MNENLRGEKREIKINLKARFIYHSNFFKEEKRQS